MIEITSTKFAKTQGGYKVTVAAKDNGADVTATYSVWGTSTHPNAIRQARDAARNGALNAVTALTEED